LNFRFVLSKCIKKRNEFLKNKLLSNGEVKIAEKFAIDFSLYCLTIFYNSLETGIDLKVDSIEELLEIFKTEVKPKELF